MCLVLKIKEKRYIQCIKAIKKFLDFIQYQYAQTMMEPLSESKEEFNAKMQQGIDDMKAGRVTPLKEAFAEIKAQFA